MIWEQDFAKNKDWLQCKRASKNAETALYYVFVFAVTLAALWGFTA